MTRWLDSEQAKVLMDARPVARTVALSLIGWGTRVGRLTALQDLHPNRSAGDQAVLDVITELAELELVSVSEVDGVFTVSWRSPAESLPPSPHTPQPPTLKTGPSGSPLPYGRDFRGPPPENHREEHTPEVLQEGPNRPQLGLPGMSNGEPTTRKKTPTASQIMWRDTERLVRLWVDRTGRPEVDLKVTPYRIKLVRDRLREGYTWEELAMAVAGVAYSPWHRDHGRDVFELAVGEGQVDKAKALWWSHAPVDVVRAYQDRTGHTPPAREGDLQAVATADKVEVADRERWTRTSREVAQLQDARRREAEAQAAKADQWAGVFNDDDQDQEADHVG